MPRKGRLRSEKQQKQTKFISTVRHRSQDELKSITAAGGLPTSKANVQRLNREITQLKKGISNSTRREQRLREKLAKKSEEATTLRRTHQQNETALHKIEARYSDELSKSNEKVQGLQKTVKRLSAYVKGETKRSERAVQRAIKQVTSGVGSLNVRHVKTPQGVVEDWVRDLICVLVGKHGTPASRVYSLVCSVAEALGIKIVGKWSERTAGRAVDEGGLAAEQMIVHSIRSCMGMLVVQTLTNALRRTDVSIAAVTFSGDGTGCSNIQHDSRHITVIPSNHTDPTDYFVGIKPEVNHTTATQLAGWKAVVDQLCATYNTSPQGKDRPVDPLKIWQKLTGYLSDHAADQKKISNELETIHREADRELRGRAAVLSEPLSKTLEVLDAKGEEMMERIGGHERWMALSEVEQAELGQQLVRETNIHLGEEAYQRLSAEEKRRVDLYVWTGCGMHKDLNAAKGGAERMSKWWEESGETPPVELMNKFKAQAAAATPKNEDPTSAKGPGRGAVKLASLLGALVKHKDPDKGHQHRFRAFCLRLLHYEVQFPDTSNTRYQSHLYAATEIIDHHQLYLDFLRDVADRKDKRKLNHMEQNVLDGLNDIPTITELCVLCLYCQAVSAPFVKHIRGPQSKSQNALDLAPFYDRIITHLQTVINNPDLLIGANASPETGSLDGQPWENPIAINTILQNRHLYPHLRPLLVEFLTGALETWKRFTKEFEPGSNISNLTPEERYFAFRQPSNDKNEGSLGLLRGMYRSFPNITLRRLNSRLMIRFALSFP